MAADQQSSPAGFPRSGLGGPREISHVDGLIAALTPIVVRAAESGDVAGAVATISTALDQVLAAAIPATKAAALADADPAAAVAAIVTEHLPGTDAATALEIGRAVIGPGPR